LFCFLIGVLSSMIFSVALLSGDAASPIDTSSTEHSLKIEIE
jgi:hypothetical protein